MSASTPTTPLGLPSYLKSLKRHNADGAVEQLIFLLKRRQIFGSRSAGVALIHLYLKVVAETKFKNVNQLIERVRGVGTRLAAAQPREIVVGNITRRLLALVREVTEEGTAANSEVNTPKASQTRLSALQGGERENSSVPDITLSMRDIKDDVLNGLREMLEELDQADEQVAGYALEHIYGNETILTYSSSLTVQRYLLAAAKKRKITVIQPEGYPNEIDSTYETILNGRTKRDAEDATNENRLKSLSAAGINVILIPDAAIYAVMPQVSAVLLPMHIGFPNGGFIAPASGRMIAEAAKAHGVPVTVLGAIYKLSPLHPYDPAALTEMGDAGKVLDYRDGDMVDRVEVINPIADYVPPELVNLFVTSIGAFPPSFMYRVVADHYRDEDIDP